MTKSDFIRKHPQLFHMASSNSLEQIKQHGLLSTEATLDLLQIKGAKKNELLEKRRPQSVELQHKDLGTFILRDQKPLRDEALSKCLKGMSPAEFYRLLNERTFLWANRERVERLLAARAYRKYDQLVLTLDTALVVADHGDEMELASINSGATLYGNPPARGRETFSKLDNYELINLQRPIVEVTIKSSIPNIKNYIVEAEIRKAQST